MPPLFGSNPADFNPEDLDNMFSLVDDTKQSINAERLIDLIQEIPQLQRVIAWARQSAENKDQLKSLLENLVKDEGSIIDRIVKRILECLDNKILSIKYLVIIRFKEEVSLGEVQTAYSTILNYILNYGDENITSAINTEESSLFQDYIDKMGDSDDEPTDS